MNLVSISAKQIVDQVKREVEDEIRATNRATIQRSLINITRYEYLEKKAIERTAGMIDRHNESANKILGGWLMKSISDEADPIVLSGRIGELLDSLRKHINALSSLPASMIPPPPPQDATRFKEIIRSGNSTELMDWAMQRNNIVFRHYQTPLEGIVSHQIAESLAPMIQFLEIARQRILSRANPLTELGAEAHSNYLGYVSDIDSSGPMKSLYSSSEVMERINFVVETQLPALKSSFQNLWFQGDLSRSTETDDINRSLKKIMTDITKNIIEAVKPKSLLSVFFENKEKIDNACSEILSFLSVIDKALTDESRTNDEIRNHLVVCGKAPAVNQLFDKIVAQAPPNITGRDKYPRITGESYLIIRIITNLRPRDIKLVVHWASQVTPKDDRKLGHSGMKLNPDVAALDGDSEYDSDTLYWEGS